MSASAKMGHGCKNGVERQKVLTLWSPSAGKPTVIRVSKGACMQSKVQDLSALANMTEGEAAEAALSHAVCKVGLTVEL